MIRFDKSQKAHNSTSQGGGGNRKQQLQRYSGLAGTGKLERRENLLFPPVGGRACLGIHLRGKDGRRRLLVFTQPAAKVAGPAVNKLVLWTGAAFVQPVKPAVVSSGHDVRF